MKRGRGAWFEDFAIILVALGLLLALAAHGEEPPLQVQRVPVPIGECKMPECGILTGEALEFIRQANQDTARIIADLQRQLRELQKAKGCSKLEVTEPSRNFVPNKERDS